MGCLAIFSLREALHEVELSSTFRNGLQQLTTPLHSVSPIQQLVSQFYSSFTAVLTRAHAHTYYISFRGALRDKLLRKLHSVTGAQHQTSATCNATFLTVARQVAEKIAQCNRTFTRANLRHPCRSPLPGMYPAGLISVRATLPIYLIDQVSSPAKGPRSRKGGGGGRGARALPPPQYF